MNFDVVPFTIHPALYSLIDFAIQASLYLIVATAAYFLLFKSRLFKKQKLDQKAHPSKQVSTEIKQSLLTLVFFAISGAATYAISLYTHLFHFYARANQYGYFYFFISPLIFLILHDTYFYWSHRFLHHPKIFRRGHEFHHRSYSPTPFTIYSFNLFESFLDSLYVPIIALFLPIHPYAMFAFLLISLSYNLVGHLGHELYPPRFFRSFWAEILTTSTHHQFHHHGGPRTNFGFYFRIWDRICGTEDPRYAVAVRKYAQPVLDSAHGADVSREHSCELTG